MAHGDQPSIDFAWRVHAAQEAWTNKVDTKASILLAIESGTLFAVTSANGEGGLLSAIASWRQAVETGAIIVLLIAIALSAAAVYPRLGSVREHLDQHAENVIYFGHVRHWQPSRLKCKLETLDADTKQLALARQLVTMSRINWRKHRLVQVSMMFAAASITGLTVAALA